jgi:hypothetical protein
MAILNKSLSTYLLGGTVLFLAYYGYKRYMYPTQFNPNNARHQTYQSPTRPINTASPAQTTTSTSTKH